MFKKLFSLILLFSITTSHAMQDAPFLAESSARESLQSDSDQPSIFAYAPGRSQADIAKMWSKPGQEAERGVQADEEQKKKCQSALAAAAVAHFSEEQEREKKASAETESKEKASWKPSELDAETERIYGKLEPYTKEIDASLCAHMVAEKNCHPRITEIINMWKQKVLDDKAGKKDSFQFLPKRLLLVGPAGTGKTTIGKAIAAECDMPYFMHLATDIATPYKNTGTPNLKKIFADAVAAGKPCVVILDEIGVLLQQHRNKNDTDAGMLTKLWRLLDDHKKDPILFIATANDVSKAPAAIVTRFSGNKIETSLPNLEQRTEILKYHMDHKRSNPTDFSGITAEELAIRTNGFSHRHLEQLVENILQKTVSSGKYERATMEHGSQAISSIVESDSELNGEKNRNKWKLRIVKGAGALLAIGVPLGTNYWMHKRSLVAQDKTATKSAAIGAVIAGTGTFALKAGHAIFGIIGKIVAANKKNKILQSEVDLRRPY